MLAWPRPLLAKTGVDGIVSEAHLSLIEREQVVTILTESREALFAKVESLSDAQWSFRQSADRWTIGANVEHLGLVERVSFGQVKRAVTKPANLEWEAVTAGKEELLREGLLDRSTRRDAPDAVAPTGEINRTEVLRIFHERREESLRFAVETTEPLKAHTQDHPRPVYGTLNAYQWLLFIAYHTMRHIDQIVDVQRAPGFPAA